MLLPNAQREEKCIKIQHTNKLQYTAGCSGLLVWCIGELKEKLKENIAWLCVNDLFVF